MKRSEHPIDVLEVLSDDSDDEVEFICEIMSRKKQRRLFAKPFPKNVEYIEIPDYIEPEHGTLTELHSDEEEYKSIEKFFRDKWSHHNYYNHVTTPKVTKIHRIEFHPHNMDKYLECQQGQEVTRMFHGTSWSSVQNIAKTGFLMKHEQCGGHFVAFHSGTSHGYCMKSPRAYGMLVVDVALPSGFPEPRIAYNSNNDFAFIPRFVISYK